MSIANPPPLQPMLARLMGETTEKTPFWLMRQAGRYLPEYQAVRQKAGGFLELCLNPDLASQVTLQPIERFDMDGAILFSDILILAYGLGQNLRFDEGIGPILTPIRDLSGIHALNHSGFESKIAPVLETIKNLKRALTPSKTLIGFAGAPWTVTSYMIEGKTSRDFRHSKQFAFTQPDQFQILLDMVTDHTIIYLTRQIEAGVDCVQIFDSWAGMLDEESFTHFVIKPTQKIISALKTRFPACPIICFPRHAGLLLENFCQACPADAINLDPSVPLDVALKLKETHIVQGNLDPIRLLSGGPDLEKTILRWLDKMGNNRYIFNLGHGILPETPPEHVTRLAKVIKDHGIGNDALSK
ncbi:MAG: uroporphyrinogen decarboxylase [Candidatus Symbiobacter sp.]|nr:uroporphyrinogen decarboxylase [Candidatus Symbiobacter sp.]